MSSGGDGDRHREHLGVSQTKQAKKKKSRRSTDPEDIAGSISSAPERISHDTHLFAVSFGTADPRQYYPNYRRPVGTPSPTGTSPQLSAMRLGDSSSDQSDGMAGTPLLTQRFVHPDVSPSSTAAPSATPHDTMFALAPGQKDRLGRPTFTGYSLSTTLIGSDQSDGMAGTPLLTQRFVHPDVSPSFTAAPSATPHDTMFALAPGQKDRLGRVMIEPDRLS
ncbi:hypothetical protein MTR67_018576 [Solanum verrucosum]|uniref:Uncharacterized protein n=1 Tax=Solanum verrucosum TaxID=315347 RepID=A0AAF0TMI1_SOLVR|nr:hypothetical protein MTR67_018576 [Solanum verrucosum]